MRPLLQFGLLLALVHLPFGASAQERLADAIAAAYGNAVTAAQVELPAGTSFACEAEQVRITAASRISSDVTQISVQCPKTSALPVIAWVHTSELPQASTRVTKAVARKIEDPPLIKAGTRATLELVNQGMRITLPVVTLGPGRAGETIRVMDTTGRLRYRATVISAELLRAELP